MPRNPIKDTAIDLFHNILIKSTTPTLQIASLAPD